MVLFGGLAGDSGLHSHSSLCTRTLGVALVRDKFGRTISRHSDRLEGPGVAFHPILASASSLADLENGDVFRPSMPHHSGAAALSVDGDVVSVACIILIIC